jgi:hypothetical protein
MQLFNVQPKDRAMQEENSGSKYSLKVRNVGSYNTDSLTHMVWVILRHRIHHFLKGEGFRD